MVVVVAPVVNTITALIWVDIDRTGVVVAAVVANLVRNMWEGNLMRVRSYVLLCFDITIIFLLVGAPINIKQWKDVLLGVGYSPAFVFYLFYLSLNDHDHDDQ